MKKKYDICIVGGLGHVGLPLGVVFASKGLSVCLHDINDKTAKIVFSDRKMPFVEHKSEKLLKSVVNNGKFSQKYERSLSWLCRKRVIR